MIRGFKWYIGGFAVFMCCCIGVFLYANSNARAEEPGTSEPGTSEPVTVILDERILEFDVQPIIMNDRTMVPMRVIFEELGATIAWDDATKTVTATKDGTVIKTTIGSTIMYINGITKEVDVAPVIVDNRTLVPLRFVSEALGCDVEWNDKNRTAYIYSRDATEYTPD